MTGLELGEVIALGVAMLGTGSWIGFTIKNHETRIQRAEKAVTDKVAIVDCEQRRRRCPIIGLESDMPRNLRERVQTLESGKLDRASHTEMCAAALRTIEVKIETINKTMTEHAGRLAKGDELFMNLNRLAGKMETALDILKKANEKGR